MDENKFWRRDCHEVFVLGRVEGPVDSNSPVSASQTTRFPPFERTVRRRSSGAVASWKMAPAREPARRTSRVLGLSLICSDVERDGEEGWCG